MGKIVMLLMNREVPTSYVFLLFVVVLGLSILHLRKFRNKGKECAEYVDLSLDFFNEDNRYLSIKDEEKRYFLVNRAFLALHGKEEEVFLGKRDRELIDEDLAALMEAMDEKVLSNAQVVEEEIASRGRVYRVRKFPVRLPGKRKGIGVNALDITEDVEYQQVKDRIIRRNEILIEAFEKEFATSHDQMDYVLNQALALTESDYGYIYFYDAEKKLFSLENFAIQGRVSSKRRSFRQNYRLENMGLWSQSVVSRQPMIYNRMKRGERQNQLGENTFNLMTVPVLLEDQVVAVVGVANNPKGYGKTDAEELSILMTGAFTAKERREFTVALKAANQDLQENKEKLTLILNSSTEGIYGMDTEGRFTFVNESALHLLGYDKMEELIGKNCHELIHHQRKNGEPYPAEDCSIYQAIPRGETVTSEEEIFLRKDGTSFAVRFSAHPQMSGREITGAVVTFSDITTRKIQEENVRYLTYHDPLTGLYNRAYLDKVYRELEDPVQEPLCIVVGDVNGLKLSNDIFGHARGDLFLKRIAEVIQRTIREEDLVFRVGGDEFYIFLRNTLEDDARRVMERITEAVEKEDYKGVRGSISLGLSLKDQGKTTLEEALNDAEQNMYREKTLRAKMEGKRQFSYLISQLMHYPTERTHAENTRTYASAIGKVLSLPQDRQKALEDAAYLHDVGKIPAIFNHNLGEPAVYPTRKDHAVVGYRILNSFEETLDIAKAVLSHHEKWNGTGYPKGLSGEEIPLSSRIIAVAEKYDRLTCGSYGEALSQEKALEKIRQHRGVTLDPAVVDALIVSLG